MIDRTRKQPAKIIDISACRSRLKIGAVSYLNSKPLVEGLTEFCPEASLLLDVPSRLADDLAQRTLDVALIPSVESFLDPDYEVVSDACVATHGPVLSVKLYSRVHPGDIKTLALDEGSRTSAALSQIILHERFGVRPELQKLPLSKTTVDSNADAVLLIGDRAMFAPAETFHTVWDLGEEWVNWTGLPFVFAMWVTRKDVELGNLAQKLSFARDRGLAELERIAADGAQALGISRETSLNYLRHNLYFRLGSAERAGLKLFQQLAANLNLAGRSPLAFREAISFQPASVRQRIEAGSVEEQTAY